MPIRTVRIAWGLATLSLVISGIARADRYDDAGRAIRAVLEREGFPIEVATTSDANTFVDPVALTADWQRVHPDVLTAFGEYFEVAGRPTGVFVDNNAPAGNAEAEIRENVAFYSDDPRLQVAVIRGLFGEPRPRYGMKASYLAYPLEMPKISDGFLDEATGRLDFGRVGACIASEMATAGLGGEPLDSRGAIALVATRWFADLPDDPRDAWSRRQTQFRYVVRVVEIAGRSQAGEVTFDSGTGYRISVDAFCEVRRTDGKRTLLRVGPVAAESFGRTAGETVLVSSGRSTPVDTLPAADVPDPAPPAGEGQRSDEAAGRRATLNMASSEPLADYAQQILERLRPTLVSGCGE